MESDDALQEQQIKPPAYVRAIVSAEQEFGDDLKWISTLGITREDRPFDPSCPEGRFNYTVEIVLSPDERAKPGSLPDMNRVYCWGDKAEVKGRIWDLIYVGIRDLLARRNPWGPRFDSDNGLYLKDTTARGDTVYVPVKEFEGFPATGVFLVWTDVREPGRHASFTWIGDMPTVDALTYAEAHVHAEAACRALADLKNEEMLTSLQIQRAADGGEPVYSWREPSISEQVQCVLNAIAEGNLKARRARAAAPEPRAGAEQQRDSPS